jgi:hypothetical protein
MLSATLTVTDGKVGLRVVHPEKPRSPLGPMGQGAGADRGPGAGCRRACPGRDGRGRRPDRRSDLSRRHPARRRARSGAARVRRGRSPRRHRDAAGSGVPHEHLPEPRHAGHRRRPRGPWHRGQRLRRSRPGRVPLFQRPDLDRGRADLVDRRSPLARLGRVPLGGLRRGVAQRARSALLEALRCGYTGAREGRSDSRLARHSGGPRPPASRHELVSRGRSGRPHSR